MTAERFSGMSIQGDRYMRGKDWGGAAGSNALQGWGAASVGLQRSKRDSSERR